MWLEPWEVIIADVSLPLVLSVLDGNGAVGLYVGTDYDDISVVDEAILWFDATPVPEPTTLALLGLGALALIRRRR